MKIENSDISKDQLSEMQHALGLTRVKKPNRNMFYTNGDDANWNDLVSKGYATKGSGWTAGKAYFFVTWEGLKRIYSKPISKKYFSEI